MKLVIKNKKVIATHDDNQDIESLYPDCQFATVTTHYEVGDDYEITIDMLKDIVSKQIIYKYNCALEYGIFAINETHYANMSWYKTWSKAVSLYDSGLVLSDNFTVRLYVKSNSTYYNQDTTQTLPTFKTMLQTLNSQQFIKYQPIRNNLISQLNLATTIAEIEYIESIIDSSFGDIIDETTTIIEYGE